MGARSSYEHLRQSFRNVGFIATVAVKGLRVKLTLTISGHFDLLNPTRRGDQVAGVGIPSRFLCKEEKSTNKQKEKTDAPSHRL